MRIIVILCIAILFAHSSDDHSGALGNLSILLGPQDAHWIAFEDSVEVLTSKQIAHALSRLRASRASDPGTAVKSGILYKRLFLLSGDHEAQELAVRHLTTAVQAFSQSAFVHYALGSVQVIWPASPTGSWLVRGIAGAAEARRARGRKALYTALSIDPRLDRAATALAMSALRIAPESELREIRDTLVALVERDDHAPLRNVTSAAELELRIGTPERALQILNRHANSEDPIHQYDVAIALFQLADRESDATEGLYRALSNPTDALRERIVSDIAYLLNPTERSSVATPGQSLADWFIRVWRLRAAVAGTTVDQRIAEHYRRLYRARREYPRRPRLGARGATPTTLDTAAWLRDVNDQGLILIKYGAPDIELPTLGGDVSLTAWFYYRLDEPLRLYFMGSPGDVGPTLFSGVIGCGEDYYRDLIGYEPRFVTLLNQCRRAARNVDERSTLALMSRALDMEFNQLAHAAVQKEDGKPRFKELTPFYFDLFSFRGADTNTDVTAVVAVPGQFFEQSDSQPRAEIRFIVFDTVAGWVVQRDTVISMTAPARNQSHARVVMNLPVSPSKTAAFRVSVRDQTNHEKGQIYGGPYAVRSYADKPYAVSDIVLADGLSNSAPLFRGAYRLNIIPGAGVTTAAFDFYYEIYGAVRATDHRIEIVVAPDDRSILNSLKTLFKGQPQMRLSFDAADANASIVQQVQRFETELPPGRYRFTLRVLDVKGMALAETTRSVSIQTR